MSRSVATTGSRIIGPFKVACNAPGIDDQGVAVADLTPGDVVITTWVVATAEWVADGQNFGHQATVGRGPGSGQALVEYANFGVVDAGPFGIEGPADRITHRLAHVTATARSLTVSVYPASGSFTSGELEVRALIVTP